MFKHQNNIDGFVSIFYIITLGSQILQKWVTELTYYFNNQLLSQNFIEKIKSSQGCLQNEILITG